MKAWFSSLSAMMAHLRTSWKTLEKRDKWTISISLSAMFVTIGVAAYTLYDSTQSMKESNAVRICEAFHSSAALQSLYREIFIASIVKNPETPNQISRNYDSILYNSEKGITLVRDIRALFNFYEAIGSGLNNRVYNEQVIASCFANHLIGAKDLLDNYASNPKSPFTSKEFYYLRKWAPKLDSIMKHKAV